MYICICNAIRECELRKAARQFGGGGAESVYAKMGKAPHCGHCLEEADEIAVSYTHLTLPTSDLV